MANILTFKCILLLILTAYVSIAQAQTFMQDSKFLAKHGNNIVLASKDKHRQIIVSQTHQARVMTSTAHGPEGVSNGWIDRTALARGQSSGGEDRTWIAPIGSKYSLYYPVGTEMISANWRVPPALQQQNYQLKSRSENRLSFEQALFFENYIGAQFELNLKRSISLFTQQEAEQILNTSIPDNVNWVAFGVSSSLENLGRDWSVQNGAVTLWSMGMYQGQDDTKSIFPVVSSQPAINYYLMKANPQRVSIIGNSVVFRTDGKQRGKIGIPNNASRDVMGAYSEALGRLTIIRFSKTKQASYPISLEKPTTDNMVGDVINAYNHGPMDGSRFANASFFELESAAPMRLLKKGDVVTHSSDTFHFFGNKAQLNVMSKAVLGFDLLSLDLLH